MHVLIDILLSSALFSLIFSFIDLTVVLHDTVARFLNTEESTNFNYPTIMLSSTSVQTNDNLLSLCNRFPSHSFRSFYVKADVASLTSGEFKQGQ